MSQTDECYTRDTLSATKLIALVTASLLVVWHSYYVTNLYFQCFMMEVITVNTCLFGGFTFYSLAVDSAK